MSEIHGQANRDKIYRDALTHVPGEAGLWVFIFGDMLVFALFFGMIMYLRADQPEMFATSQALLHPAYGLINTVLLLTGSLFVARAMKGLRPDQKAGMAEQRVSIRYLAAAVACGLLFVSVKTTEYVLTLNAGLAPNVNDFFMYYFVFTGIHLAHLALALVGLAVVMLISRANPLTARRFVVAECGACYWHLVDLLWLVLFPLLYLVR